MKRQHRMLIAVGVIVLLVGWLAWSMLLTESDMPEPPTAQQAP